ncbi:hypothetical protein ABIE00_002857 [Arthrobacter sp. OAP107]
MATDYDELRTDFKESQENSLEALKSAKAPDAQSVVQERTPSTARPLAASYCRRTRRAGHPAG